MSGANKQDKKSSLKLPAHSFEINRLSMVSQKKALDKSVPLKLKNYFPISQKNFPVFCKIYLNVLRTVIFPVSRKKTAKNIFPCHKLFGP